MTDVRRLPGAIVEQWDWQLDASCRGMDVGHFYHPPDERNAAREQRIAEAKAICHRCPVIDKCLDHALRVREPYGIWGGHSEDERATLLGVQSLRYPARIIEVVKDQEPGPAHHRVKATQMIAAGSRVHPPNHTS